jgi:hypothetical protein
MSRVFTSEATGAAIYVFSDDHCPPHVHARHRGEGWIARASFSYIRSTIELMSIEPVKNMPLQRVVNRLLGDIQDRLPDCRRSWWMTSRTTCLANQWAMAPAPGKIVISDHVPGAKQIVASQYDPTTEQLRVSFRDGTAEEVRLRP